MALFRLSKKEIGANGEKNVARYLKKRKYKIIKTNYRTPFGEADIVAVQKNLLVFVEVKTRSSIVHGTPAEAVDYVKRERYFKIAEYFVAADQSYSSCFIRFDVAEVLGDEINYIENAFVCN